MKKRVSALRHCAAIFKIFLFFLFVLFLPHVYTYHRQAEQAHAQSSKKLILGIENIHEQTLRALADGDRPFTAGIITNHTGIDQHGNRTIDILLQKGVALTTIFVPQHGFHANVTGPCKDDICADPATRLPIVPWYSAKKLRHAYIASVDVLFFDLQDSGMRHGYVATLLDIMKEASRLHKKLVIFDRPNVLGGGMEGDPNTISADPAKLGTPLPIPVRHGMTIGELAQFFNMSVLEQPMQLQVIPMHNYYRNSSAKIPWHNLSPNIKTVNACYGHSLLGLLGEVAPFDIGIGTDVAFQCLLLPDTLHVDKQTWYTLQTTLKNEGIDSTFYRCFHARKKQYYSGLKISIRDIHTFSSFTSLLTIVDFFVQKGVNLAFSAQFDNAVGTEKIRAYAARAIPRKELEDAVYQGLKQFFTKASGSLLYYPAPKVVRI